LTNERKNKLNEIVKRCLKWLERTQFKTNDFHSGGFSPYPETVKSAGTLATADVLTFLQRSNIEKLDIINDSIKFLLRAQINENEKYPSQNGGFPPIGDFELILDTAFSDSTADAVLGLLNSLHKIEDKKYKKEITKSIEKGIEWLLNCYKATSSLPLPTYFIKEEYNIGPKRYFPTILTGLAFITYKDYCKRINKAVKQKIEEYISNLKAIILSKLKEYGNIPFGDYEEPSIMNTILGIEFLLLSNKNSKTDEETKESLKKGYIWLMGRFNELLMKGKDYIFTDFDPVHIDVPEVSEGDYPATYFTLPSMVKLLLENLFPSDLNENEKLLTSLISELLDIVEIKIIENVEVAYYWEYRGRKEPATSATASAIYTLMLYLEKGGVKP